MTSRERARRNSRIAAAHHAGVPAARLAAEFGVTPRQIANILLDWKTSTPEDADGRDSFAALLAAVRFSVDELATVAVTAENDSNRIGALRTLVEHSLLRWQVERAAGMVPRHPAAPGLATEMHLVFREFAELLRRHDVGDDALREFLALAETRMGRPAGDGRQIAA
jgi:hypothetical protein